MSRPIISKDQLIKAAGKNCYTEAERGFDHAQIKDFHYKSDQISAHINGYMPTVRYRGDQVEGACNCDASDGFDFCEHCVQLTLHANKIAQQLTALSKGPDKSKVLAYLINLDKQVLAKQLLALLEENPDAFQRYLLKASIDQKGVDYTDLKSKLTQLTRLKEKLFSQRQVKHFFARIERFLDEIEEIPATGQEEKILKLIEYSFQRINRLLDGMEDRGLQRQLVTEKLNALYQKLFPALSGRSETLARRYFNLWLDDRHSLVSSPDSALLGDAGLAHFEKLAKEHWAKDTLSAIHRHKLSIYLKELAIANNDFESEQLYRMVLAKSAEDWLQVARRWLENGQWQKAVELLEEQVDKREQKAPFVKLLIQSYRESDNALAHLKALFKHHPQLVAEALFAEAEERDALSDVESFAIDALASSEDINDSIENRSLLLTLLIRQSRTERAIAIVHQGKVDLENLIDLARYLRAKRPAESLELYQRSVEELLSKQLSKSDLRAAELLVEAQSFLEKEIEFQKIVNELQPLLRSRPNVIKLVHELQQ